MMLHDKVELMHSTPNTKEKTILMHRILKLGHNTNDTDTPPNSLMDSIASLKVKTTKGEGVGARSLAHSTLGVKGHAGTLGRGLGRMTSKSITHTDLHKPNSKLLNA